MRFPFTTLGLTAAFALLTLSQATTAQAGPACPRWDGTYVCKFAGNSMFPPRDFQMAIRTLDERGETVYLADNKDKVYPDGKPHHTDSLPIIGQYARDIDYVATCAGGGKINITGEATSKKNGMRVNMSGYMQDRNGGRNVDVVFKAKAGFIEMPFNVPCVKQ